MKLHLSKSLSKIGNSLPDSDRSPSGSKKSGKYESRASGDYFKGLGERALPQPDVEPIRDSEAHVKFDGPYQPSPQQQQHINMLEPLLGDLYGTTSNTQSTFIDVLPSFQMFLSILRRTDHQFNEDLSVAPPTYNYDDQALGASNQETSLRNDDPTTSRDRPENITPIYHENIESGNYSQSVMDRVDELATVPNSPIEIKICVTKSVPKLNQFNELEGNLKEYSSGDAVNGYILMKNASHRPVSFGLFLVSLEGTVSSIIGPSSETSGVHKSIKKKFLKMHDLSASYSYAEVPNSAGIEANYLEKDLHDGSIFGLPDERIMEPGKTYKKFFTFKFPSRLLDNTCTSNCYDHLVPPPSLGYDEMYYKKKGENVRFNKVLGYSDLHTRACPLVTKDYSFDHLNISYTIEAKFIDKVKNASSKEGSTLNDYVISKHSQYFLRFIPNRREDTNDEEGRLVDSLSSLNYLGLGPSQYGFNIMRTWKEAVSLLESIANEIDSTFPSEGRRTEKKQKNFDFSFADLLHSELGFLSEKLNAPSPSLESISSKRPLLVYKKSSKFLASPVWIGKVLLYVRIPHKVIPYWEPNLIYKYNNQRLKRNNSSFQLQPVKTAPTDSSKIAGKHEEVELVPTKTLSSFALYSQNSIYDRASSRVLKTIDISLEFEPTQNFNHPPKISLVDFNLVLWTYKSEGPMPFELGHDFFYKCPKKEFESETNSCSITRANLQILKDYSYSFLEFLSANNVAVSRETIAHLKGMNSLCIEKDEVKDFFKGITSSNHPDLLYLEEGWVAKMSPTSKLIWARQLTLPLEIINKGNITVVPSFQNCFVGRCYSVQICVRFKHASVCEDGGNIATTEVPVLVA